MKNFSLLICEDKETWNNFVRCSSTNNIFSETNFLDLLSITYKLYFIMHNENPILGCIIIDRANLDENPAYSRQMYHGLVIPKPKKISMNAFALLINDATIFLLEKITNLYDELVFCQHLATNDTRAFQWFAYDSYPKHYIYHELLHTAAIDIGNYPSFEEYFQTLSKTRKSEYRTPKKSNLNLKINYSVDDFIQIFKHTFAVQDLVLDASYIHEVHTVVSGIIANKSGSLEALYDQNDEIVSAAVFIGDGISSYYLHGATDRNKKQNGNMTFLILNHIRNCFKNGVCNLNLMGVNSPNRGYFKTSFGADVKQFHEIIIRK